MKIHRMHFVAASLLALLTFGFASPSQADTCAVRVVFTKGGFIVGVGGGQGVLTCRGKHHRFRVSGMQLQNEKGVILQLAGGKVGVELSAAVGGVTVTLE
jgi:hypothetical protein